MKKFAHLLKKEIRELVTKQTVISLAFMLLLFNFIGQVSRKEAEKATAVQTVSVLDLDGSATSRSILAGLEAARFRVSRLETTTPEQAVESTRSGDSKLLLVIPRGFAAALESAEPRPIETYTFMRSFSLIGARSSAILRGVLAALNDVLSAETLRRDLPGRDPDRIKNPIRSRDFVIVKSRMAEGSAAQVAGLVSSQSLLIPVVLMMIMIYSSQMVISAVAMEKQNKTLETLLTVPISRAAIITAKMLAAGLVGLLSAGIYMLGFQRFMGGFEAGMGGSAQSSEVLKALGLSFNTSGYLILGASLFMAILCVLALAMILGVLAEDLHSAQTMIMPLIFLVMIPYFISLFADINTVSLPVKAFILAIPFSHPFLATQNIYLENYGLILGGIGYMVLVFAALIFFAARIFSTDRILTMKLRWGKKRAGAV